jgi:ABC-type antimicrobial peptide transport system permease subunit
MEPVVIGLVIGVGGAMAGGRYLESVLFGVRPQDPVVFGVATALMGGVALLGAVIPAIRASGGDPAKALHDR